MLLRAPLFSGGPLLPKNRQLVSTSRRRICRRLIRQQLFAMAARVWVRKARNTHAPATTAADGWLAWHGSKVRLFDAEVLNRGGAMDLSTNLNPCTKIRNASEVITGVRGVTRGANSWKCCR
jgi:hypothetical protein